MLGPGRTRARPPITLPCGEMWSVEWGIFRRLTTAASAWNTSAHGYRLIKCHLFAKAVLYQRYRGMWRCRNQGSWQSLPSPCSERFPTCSPDVLLSLTLAILIGVANSPWPALNKHHLWTPITMRRKDSSAQICHTKRAVAKARHALRKARKAAYY